MVELRRISSNRYIANFFKSGISLHITRQSRGFINFRMSVPASYRNTVVGGILGNFDGDRAVEFFARDSDEHIPYRGRPDRTVYRSMLTCKLSTPKHVTQLTIIDYRGNFRRREPICWQ